ncbi:MAG: apolipoprotein N-acyltransferase [Planctomycetaceae bacterium]|jgi:apolipoprotein N-acyltransferase|nr:apolipoprotein N-acyltransferase [Planctomycetaceae bacterium]
MNWCLFFLGSILYCLLQFAIGSQICLLVFLVPVFWMPLILTDVVIRYRYVYFSSFLFWFVSVSWIVSPHPAAVFGLVVLSSVLSLYWLLFFISARSAVHLFRFPAMVVVPVCWIGCEYLRNCLFGGFSFCSLEHLLFVQPVLIQIADIGGGYLVGGMIMFVGAGLGTILFSVVGGQNKNQLAQNQLAQKKLAQKESNETEKINAQNNKPKSNIIYPAIFTAIALFATFTYGYLTIYLGQNANAHSSKIAEQFAQLKIATLQGTAPVSISMTTKQFEDCLQQYINLTREAVIEREQTNNDPNNKNERYRSLDLIIWPETVCPIPYVVFENGAGYESVGWSRAEVERSRQLLLSWSAQCRSPILYGISTLVVDGVETVGGNSVAQSREPYRLNSALLVTPNPPSFKARYDKIQLVMFGEYVPFAEYLPENFPLRTICQEAGRGKKSVAIPIGVQVKNNVENQIYASVNICFESTVPHHVRGQILELKREGKEPAVLINISNSGWFGFSKQIDQHLATHIFRAVENRRPYITATNGGFSASIDCFGRIRKIGKRKSAEAIVDDVVVQYWTPLYHCIGDIHAIVCTICVIIFSIFSWRHARRQKKK